MKLKTSLIAVAASLLLASVAPAQPYGMGAGMMGGRGAGYGMGYGMMGPGAGMGPGTMWGDADEAYAGLDLSREQRTKIADIDRQTSKAMWQIMGSMHEQGYSMHRMFQPGALDESAARKAFQAMEESRKAMFELQLDGRKKVDAVLTQEQRDQLRSHWGRR